MTRVGPLILCRRCKGTGSLNDKPCPRCSPQHAGVDPESYEGCLCGEEHEPTPGGAVIDLGEHPGFPTGGRVKIEVTAVNPDGSQFEHWTGPGAWEAARALIEDDWQVLVEPAPAEGVPPTTTERAT